MSLRCSETCTWRVVTEISSRSILCGGYLDMLRGWLTFQDPKQFLFFTRTPSGIRAGKEFLARLKERAENRDKEITIGALQAQLKALRSWGSKQPADLSKVHHPVLVANGDSDRMVPSINTRDLAQRLPNGELIIYPDSGHGAVFQFHADFVPKALEFFARPQMSHQPGNK